MGAEDDVIVASVLSLLGYVRDLLIQERLQENGHGFDHRAVLREHSPALLQTRLVGATGVHPRQMLIKFNLKVLESLLVNIRDVRKVDLIRLELPEQIVREHPLPVLLQLILTSKGLHEAQVLDAFGERLVLDVHALIAFSCGVLLQVRRLLDILWTALKIAPS